MSVYVKVVRHVHRPMFSSLVGRGPKVTGVLIERWFSATCSRCFVYRSFDRSLACKNHSITRPLSRFVTDRLIWRPVAVNRPIAEWLARSMIELSPWAASLDPLKSIVCHAAELNHLIARLTPLMVGPVNACSQEWQLDQNTHLRGQRSLARSLARSLDRSGVFWQNTLQTLARSLDRSLARSLA